MLVHQELADNVRECFGYLRDAGYAIEKMKPHVLYGYDDARTMADNNTSADRPDFIGDPARGVLSKHFCGVAVDIEPMHNKDLFLIYEADFYTEQNIEALFATAQPVLGKFSKLSKTWLVSSKYEESVIAQTARAARHKLISRPYIASAIIALLLFILFTVLMVSRFRE